MVYNYLTKETKDIIDYIQNELTFTERLELIGKEKEDAANELYEQLVNEDSVTGNASGTYTFNILRAERNLVGNWTVLQSAIEEINPGFDAIKQGAEACDVLVRIYLLPTAIDNAIAKIWELDRKSDD